MKIIRGELITGFVFIVVRCVVLSMFIIMFALKPHGQTYLTVSSYLVLHAPFISNKRKLLRSSFIIPFARLTSD